MFVVVEVVVWNWWGVADGVAVVGGGEGVGGVFDDGQAMFGGDGIDGIEVGGETGDMNGNDGPCSFRDGRFDLLRIDVEITWPDIHEHRLRVEIAHHFRRGGKGIGCCDNFITRFQTNGFQRFLDFPKFFFPDVLKNEKGCITFEGE